MTQEELKIALDLHEKWLSNKPDGVKLDLRHADLRDADLKGANLEFADLRWAHTINTEGLDVICVQLNTSDKNRQIQYYVQLEKVTAGCFSGTLDELKIAVREKYDIDSVIYNRYEIAFKTIEDILETY